MMIKKVVCTWQQSMPLVGKVDFTAICGVSPMFQMCKQHPQVKEIWHLLA